MRRQLAPLLAVFTVLILSAPADAQTAKTSDAKAVKAKAVPRTADGHPDFTGVWTNVTLTPMDRPKELAGKEFFTPRKRLRMNAKGHPRATSTPLTVPATPPTSLAAPDARAPSSVNRSSLI